MDAPSDPAGYSDHTPLPLGRDTTAGSTSDEADSALAHARVFPCSNCGASLRFEPGVGALVCASCGTRNERPTATASAQQTALEELDYVTYLRRQAGNEPEIAVQLLACPQCGASTTLGPNEVTGTCAFCATPLVATSAQADRIIRPRGVVPFAVDRNAAAVRFREWIGSLWFAPNALKHTVKNVDATRGVYVPCWTFDAQTTSRYSGERGIDRHVQETRKDASGNTVIVTRTVTDWYPASGVVQLAFDDTLVAASHSLPDKFAGALSNWDIRALEPYADDYVAGFTVEAYQLALEPAFGEAKIAFDRGIHSAVEADIGGHHQRIHDIDTRYDGVTFKHILLPAWITSYRFRDRSWRVVVNGQTGAVVGDRPYSPWKIAFVILCLVAIVVVVQLARQQ